MTWQQTFIASVLGCFISALMVMAMARPGMKYHLGFPVLCRSVMGMWGAFFFIFIRGVVCIIWFGVQTVSFHLHPEHANVFS
jgi:NCS1 family nucleobase:cation symporter-1